MYPCKYFKISLNDQGKWWIQTDWPTPTPGIRIETNMSPLPLVGGHKKLAQKFNFPYNYIDDVLCLNNSRISEFTSIHVNLKFKIRQSPTHSASYLVCYLCIDNGKLVTCTRLYCKRDDFNFSIVNFPYLSNPLAGSET